MLAAIQYFYTTDGYPDPLLMVVLRTVDRPRYFTIIGKRARI